MLKPSQKRRLFYNYLDKTPLKRIKPLEELTINDIILASRNKQRAIINSYKGIIAELNEDYNIILKENQ